MLWWCFHFGKNLVPKDQSLAINSFSQIVENVWNCSHRGAVNAEELSTCEGEISDLHPLVGIPSPRLLHPGHKGTKSSWIFDGSAWRAGTNGRRSLWQSKQPAQLSHVGQSLQRICYPENCSQVKSSLGQAKKSKNLLYCWSYWSYFRYFCSKIARQLLL